MSAIKLKSLSGSVSIEPEDAIGDTVLLVKNTGGAVVSTGSIVTATIPGSIIGSIEVFDGAGVSIGFIPMYDSIS